MTEKTYLVTWQITSFANSPEEAARKSLAIQRDPDSIATVFDVCDTNGETVTIDLLACDLRANLTTG